MIRASDKKLITDFEELVDIIRGSNQIDLYESAGDKRKRIAWLLSDYEAFCQYYFKEYCYAPMGWFHKEHFPYIYHNPNHIYLMQYAREFAKTTHGTFFLPMFLKFNQKLTGMMVGSHDNNMAGEKLIDIQANLEANPRIIHDFGEQKTYGDWEHGWFKSKDGVAFYAFGKDQSPRGYKFKWNRPNFGAIDDLNEKKGLKNDAISLEDKKWAIADLKAALQIKEWRLLVLQNKFHDNTCTALIENDEQIESTVFKVDMLDAKGNSNWPENFTNEMAYALEKSEGGIFISERMNTPFEEGTTIKAEWLNEWIEPLPYDKYDGVLIHYLDPSYKGTETADFKAWVLLGKTGLFYDILDAWVERTESGEMWEHAFDIDEEIGEEGTVKHVMEANFIQEAVHEKELRRVEKDKGRALRVSMDYRSKEHKLERIGTLAPLFKRGLIRFNKLKRDTPGMKRLRTQLLAIGEGSKVNDDAPDALEGGIWYLDKKGNPGRKPRRGGKYKKDSKRTQ